MRIWPWQFQLSVYRAGDRAGSGDSPIALLQDHAGEWSLAAHKPPLDKSGKCPYIGIPRRDGGLSRAPIRIPVKVNQRPPQPAMTIRKPEWNVVSGQLRRHSGFPVFPGIVRALRHKGERLRLAITRRGTRQFDDGRVVRLGTFYGSQFAALEGFFLGCQLSMKRED